MRLSGPMVMHPEKVTGYLLSHSSPHKSAKATFFESFGFTLQDPELVRRAFLLHGLTNEVIEIQDSNFGTKFKVCCSINTPDGRNPCITTVWITDQATGNLRFVTAVPRETKLMR